MKLIKNLIVWFLIRQFAHQSWRGPHGTTLYCIRELDRHPFLTRLISQAMREAYRSAFSLPPEKGSATATSMVGELYYTPDELRETLVVCKYTSIIATFAYRILDGPKGLVLCNHTHLINVDNASLYKELAQWVIKNAVETYNIRFVVGKTVDPYEIDAALSMRNYDPSTTVPPVDIEATSNDLIITTSWLVTRVYGLLFGDNLGQVSTMTLVLRRGRPHYMIYVAPDRIPQMVQIFSKASFRQSEVEQRSCMFYGVELQ